MAFTLQQVVPWGRNLSEYTRMFALTKEEQLGKIASFGDGPASFQKEMNELGNYVRSYDPIYQFEEEQLRKRLYDTKDEVMKQIQENLHNFIWQEISSPEQLENIRMQSMNHFLDDFSGGKKEGRYISHQLPDPIPCEDQYYDLGLSSHFLLMYNILGYEFHIKAISEMLRACREVRIFPVLNLNAEESELSQKVSEYFSQRYDVALQNVNYEFQKGGNRMMRITKRI